MLHGCRAWGEQDARARGLQPETDTAALSGVIAHWDSSKAEHGYGFTRAWWRPMITCSAWNRSPAQFIRGTSCKRDLLKKGCVMALSNNVQEKAKLKLQILKSKAKKEQPLMELWKRVVHNSTLPVLRTAFSHRPLPPCPV